MGETFNDAVLTSPDAGPVSLADVKAHLRLAPTFTADDELIASELLAATEWCQDQVHRQFVSATRQLYLDRFPVWEGRWAQQLFGASGIAVPRPPLLSVTSVSYVDPAGATQVLDAAQYQVSVGLEPGRIWPAYGRNWPSTRVQPQAVTVVYVAGYGTADQVPAAARQAVRMMTAHLYEFREPVITGPIATTVPMAVRSLLGTLNYGYRW